VLNGRVSPLLQGRQGGCAQDPREEEVNRIFCDPVASDTDERAFDENALYLKWVRSQELFEQINKLFEDVCPE
jgi:hypothetical protein